MNYEIMPAQIRCTKCKTIQDASHKFCKECGINFTDGKIHRSIFEQADKHYQKEWDRGIKKWIESEKRYFIPPATCDQIRIPLISNPALSDAMLTCISTSPEAKEAMSEAFNKTYMKPGVIAAYADTAMKGTTEEAKQRVKELLPNKITKD